MQYTRRCARKRGSLEYLYLEGVLQKGSSLEGILKVWVHLIYKSKHGVSVCVDKNWAVPGRLFQSLPVPCGAGDKQGEGRAGRPGQPLWGAARGAISIKEIVGENRGTCI
jgi:hypothetical protein